jgi:hypothetical protein
LAFTIELTRGESWREPAEIVDRQECATNSIEAATAEAWVWLVETQKHAPEPGATHYRVVVRDNFWRPARRGVLTCDP